MKTIEELQSDLAAVNARLEEAVKKEIELRFRMISEDIYAWLQKGGCLECNGTGVAFPWKESLDTIDCPACDGTSPTYSLCFADMSKPVDSPYFPEAHYSLMDAATTHHRQTNKKWKPVPFWTNSRSQEKATAADATHILKIEKGKLEDSIRAAKLALNSNTTSQSTLPNLHGVSIRQVSFGKACRKAAIAGSHVTEADAAKYIESRYWIDNFKHLLGR